MPYRLDICCPPPDVLDLLVQWGALDIEPVPDGLAALLPDGVTPDTVTGALGGARVTVSTAVARDNGSVWLLRPRAAHIGSVLIVPVEETAPPMRCGCSMPRLLAPAIIPPLRCASKLSKRS